MSIVAYGYGISPGAGSGPGGTTVVEGMLLSLANNSGTLVLQDDTLVLELDVDAPTLELANTGFQLVVDEDDLYIRSC